MLRVVIDANVYVSAYAPAVEARAVFVVTGDPDLLDIREREGVRIITPRAFLELLRVQ